MSDLLSIARSGVTTYSRALEVVADNVANAGTPGHVRRLSTLGPTVVEGGIAPLEKDPLGSGGVRLVAITRAADALQTDTLRRAEGQVHALQSTSRWLAEVQGALSGANALDGPINGFFTSLSDLAADPTSNAVRATFLASAATVADRFNAMADSLQTIDSNLQLEARTQTKALTGLAKSLADVNTQMRRAAPGGKASVVLADERDRILSSMATYVTFEVTFDSRGQASVRVPDAGGPALVEGEVAHAASIRPDGGWLTLRIGDGGTAEMAAMTGGSLAGLSKARMQVSQAIDGVDMLADRIANEVNAVHMAGTDLLGNPGEPLFTTHKAFATSATANGGTARITTDLAPGATPSPLNLVHDGSQWILARDDLSASVSGSLPLTLDGVTVDLAGGTPRNGDLYTITTVAGARGIAAANLTPGQVAAASNWLGEAAGANTGSGTIAVRSAAAAVPPSTGPWAVSTLADGSLQLVDDLGTVLATGLPGDWLSGDGFAVRINGTPAEGDVFRVAPVGNGDGGNGNALALLALRDGVGPAGTIGDQQDLIVNRIAVPLHDVDLRLEVATANRDSIAENLNHSSGVDLNTEATEMLRLQQAYQANARIIQTARDTFDSILKATA